MQPFMRRPKRMLLGVALAALCLAIQPIVRRSDMSLGKFTVFHGGGRFGRVLPRDSCSASAERVDARLQGAAAHCGVRCGHAGFGLQRRRTWTCRR